VFFIRGNFNSENADEWVPPARRRCPRWARLASRRCRVADTHCARALNVLSGPRAGIPAASSFRPLRCRCPNRLASPRPVPTAPSPLSKAAPPPCLNPAAVRLFDAVASFVHGERHPSSPLAVLRPWSVELTFPSLLTIAGPPPTTVAPPRRKNATAEPYFFPSPSTRSSGELFFPPRMSGG
jgi:hypothetical protein